MIPNFLSISAKTNPRQDEDPLPWERGQIVALSQWTARSPWEFGRSRYCWWQQSADVGPHLDDHFAFPGKEPLPSRACLHFPFLTGLNMFPLLSDIAAAFMVVRPAFDFQNSRRASVRFFCRNPGCACEWRVHCPLGWRAFDHCSDWCRVLQMSLKYLLLEFTATRKPILVTSKTIRRV